ncbi:MAG: hypothetical protein WCH43_14135, partial [Verrucomicrobiota bacterium]
CKVVGKDQGGPPQSKTLRETLERSLPRQRPGVRQPSGALGVVHDVSTFNSHRQSDLFLQSWHPLIYTV